MTKTPWSPFRSPKAPPPPAKPKEPPAPRNSSFEAKFCDAIRRRVLVTVRYTDEEFDRTFAPHAVFHTGEGKVCVTGAEIADPAKPEEPGAPHTFEVAKVRSLSLTEQGFAPRHRFNPLDAQYRKGIICSV